MWTQNLEARDQDFSILLVSVWSPSSVDQSRLSGLRLHAGKRSVLPAWCWRTWLVCTESWPEPHPTHLGWTGTGARPHRPTSVLDVSKTCCSSPVQQPGSTSGAKPETRREHVNAQSRIWGLCLGVHILVAIFRFFKSGHFVSLRLEHHHCVHSRIPADSCCSIHCF